MFDTPALIYGITAGIVGTTIYYLVHRKQEKLRENKSGGIICPRCRQHFSEEQLFELDKLLRWPLKLYGWNPRIMNSPISNSDQNELDGFYCSRCKAIITFVLNFGVLFVLLVASFNIFLLLNHFGVIDG